MTEAQPTQPAATPVKRRYWHLCGVALGLSVFPAVFITARKTGLWPNTLLAFATFGVPFLLIGIRSWNRLLQPDRIPVRWQKGSFLNKHHDGLGLMLTLLWCPIFGVAVFLDEHTHSEAKLASYFLVFGCQGWLSLLRLCSADRKYIPSPSPSKSWTSNMKRFHSEHWGQNA